MYKTCCRCKLEKDFNCFSKNSRVKDGLQTMCKSCKKEYKILNKEKIAAKDKEYCLLNKDKLCNYQKIYKENNLEKVRKSNRLACKKWALSNKDMVNARSAKRRAAKLQALPKWLTKAEHEQIKEFYEIAEMFKLYIGEEYHVDHIIPLQGENVCGLHVPWNLQVIPAKENLSKSNKLQEQ